MSIYPLANWNVERKLYEGQKWQVQVDMKYRNSRVCNDFRGEDEVIEVSVKDNAGTSQVANE